MMKKKSYKIKILYSILFPDIFLLTRLRTYIMDTQFDFFCHKCDTPIPFSQCENCNVYLCDRCIEKHRLQKYKGHIIVLFALRGSTIKCKKHLTTICEFSCEQCDIPVCASCVSSNDHGNHTVVDFLRAFEFKKECIRRDLKI